MRVVILGAGPAGLYLGYLLKRRRPDLTVQVFEQNARDATFGFGVVFSDRAIEFLADDDPETVAAITPHLETWRDITLDLAGDVVRIDGIGFAAVGRLKLLELLQARAAAAGVELHFEHVVNDPADLGPADLVVGADGVNSLIRRQDEAAFGTTSPLMTNRFAWFGTTKRFETLTQTFRRSAYGNFNAHHYRYSPEMSTFIVEVDAATFAGLDQARGQAICEEVFADVLDGHGLISNRTIWRQFPKLANRNWAVGNRVLIGDALHTAHFSIGSGTRLAMEDAIALARALEQNGDDVAAALPAFVAARKPILDKLVGAAEASASWYENFATHMGLAPLDFAMSYITRSGRIDLDRLARISPQFVATYRAARAS
ncbi:MAG: FAD-dependent monooxygenase [Ferrovibrionaceae bacterium]